LRDATERPVTITHGTNTLLGLAPARIAEIPGLIPGAPQPESPPPLWDGRAADRIAGMLAEPA
jgi:UDP-N-acetylglucosamine 2-epimerase (non-hydrolysing)